MVASRARILVVDDDGSARADMVAALRDAGYVVKWCGSVSAGVEIVGTFRPDLVVIEMLLGGSGP